MKEKPRRSGIFRKTVAIRRKAGGERFESPHAHHVIVAICSSSTSSSASNFSKSSLHRQTDVVDHRHLDGALVDNIGTSTQALPSKIVNILTSIACCDHPRALRSNEKLSQTDISNVKWHARPCSKPANAERRQHRMSGNFPHFCDVCPSANRTGFA